jgi:hypothetical protein
MAHAVPALRFKQWLPEWDDFDFDPDQKRRRPEPFIYLFSMSAVQLRALSGVYRRQRDGAEVEGLQRLHDPARSKTIRDFVRFGHPYSGLKAPLRNEQTEPLKKPGWLPTAIVVNILGNEDERRGRRVASADVVSISENENGTVSLQLPYDDPSTQWAPSGLEPFEVIDGQHRLWAFDEQVSEGKLPGDFELPVVAFRGLDVGWQAYLFWSINVSPKRINPSHAFDLFPLLRSEAWLETFSELRIYREARAQELTELLFRHPASPWHNRINMLGESAKTAPEGAGVTQAGWVRALTSSFLGAGGGKATRGLFGAQTSRADGPLPWTRAQQAAFLITLWNGIAQAVNGVDAPWAMALREEAEEALIKKDVIPEFSGNKTMLNQEQGVRGVLSAANELFFHLATLNRPLFEWSTKAIGGGETSLDDVSQAIGELAEHRLSAPLTEFGQSIASFDWRSADGPNLTEQQRLLKRAFRGSGGYVALREQLQSHMQQQQGALAEATAVISSGNGQG